MRFKVKCGSDARKLAGEFMALAYASCGGTIGLGFMQASDEPMNGAKALEETSAPGRFEAYADYLNGRMVKTGIAWSEGEDAWVQISDHAANPDYQGWCSGRPTDPGVLANFARNSKAQKFSGYEELLRAAAQLCGVSIEKHEPATV